MSDGINPEIIKKTQQTLGKHVKKPPLTEKLLSKPPFRFLHDVVVAVIRNTGFLKGIFTQEELVAENVKEREAKLTFLNKLIDAVKFITETDLNVRATKIVAGVEVNETNLLLQAMAVGIDKKLDSSEYIKQYKNTQNDLKNTQQKTKKISKDSKINKSPKEEKSPKEQKYLENRNKIKGRELSKDRKVQSSNIAKNKKIKGNQPVISSSRASNAQTASKNDTKNKKTIVVDSPESISKTSIEEKTDDVSAIVANIVGSSTETNNIGGNVEIISEEDDRPKTRDIENGYLAKITIPERVENEDHKMEENEVIEREPEILVIESEKNVEIPIHRQTSARPKSARPRSGDFKDKNDKLSTLENKEKSKKPAHTENIVLQANNLQRPKSSLRPPSVRPSSARPGAPRLRPDSALPIEEVIPMGKINVIVENFDNDGEEEETVIIHNAPEEIEPIIDLPAKNQSHLVEQILDQIKESDDIPKTKVELDWEQDNLRGRDITSKEMNQLRNLIQSFTKAANPLGKLLNYLHEDFETMHAELQQWTKLKTQLFEEMTKQEKVKLDMNRPLLEKLEQLNQEILKQEQEIIDVRSNIIKNDLRIKELIK